MRRVAAILLLLWVVVAGSPRATAGFTDIVYGPGFSTANLIKIDQTTGVGTTLYAGYTGGQSAAMAQRASDGMIFFIAGTAGNDSVYSWNPASPSTAPVLLGQTGTGIPYCPRMFCAPDGTLYTVSTDGTKVYTISTTNGAATLHATLTNPTSGGGDIAYGPGNVVYQVAGTQLTTIPINGGATVLLGTITGGAAGASFTGMAIDIFGNMVLTDDQNPGNYYSLNPSTLVATRIGAAGAVGMEAGDLASAPRRTISGTVFEDVNYGGGAGRTQAAAGGVGLAGARVELFDAAGAFLGATTTDASGNFTFSGAAQNTYTLRVVNGTVPSSRSGYVAGLLPVQTYRTDASSGTPVDVLDHVGGEVPNRADAGACAAGGTLAGLTTAATAPQSITTVAVGTGTITGVNFGFNFDTVVNTNDAGQGSLRQFITNANALTNTGLAQTGLTAGIENAIWMIGNGTSAAGLRAAINYFAGGVATIAPASALPAVTAALVLDGTKQPGYSTTPMIELSGAGAGASAGLTLNAAGNTINRLCLDRWSTAGLILGAGGTNTVTNNFIGTTPTGTAAAGNGIGISVISSGNAIGTNGNGNVISGNTGTGLAISATGNTVKANLIGVALGGASALANGGAGLSLSAGSNTIGSLTAGDGNLIADNGNDGVFISAGTGSAIRGNSFYGNTKLAIDLNGGGAVIANNGALGSGANAGMNYPVLSSAVLSGTSLTVTGFVGSAAGQSAFGSATIDLYKADNSPADQNGAIVAGDGKSVAHGEGRTYLGTITAQANGNIASTLTVSGLAVGDALTAIATNAAGNTSEFGANATVATPIVLSGFVYNDANQNGAMDNSETGTALTLYAKVFLVGQSTAAQVVAVTPATGAYSFTGLTSGSYTIVINQDNVATNLTPSYPSGWTAIEQSTGSRTPISVAAISIPNLNFGLTNAVKLTGTVYNDNGAGGGTANDGVKNGAEAGIANVTVSLTNSTGATVYSTGTTDGSGSFQLYVPSTLSVGTALKVTQSVPSGLLATGGSAGATGGTFTRATNTVAFTVSATPTYTGLAFGDITDVTLTTDGRQSGTAGTQVIYTHTFTAASAGTVTFSVATTSTPAAPVWSSVLYQDTNGNGTLEAGEPVISAPINVVAGQTISLIQKVFIPANAPTNAQDARKLTATMVYANASPALQSAVSRVDLTTVGTAAGLTLVKAVDKASAKPGDTLTYTIAYSNTTTAAVGNLIVFDSTPAFSTFVSATNSALPSGLTAVSLTAPVVGGVGQVKWVFTGNLAPGGSGTVSFKVVVDQ